MQNLDIIEINDEQAYNAKLLASVMSTPQIRKRSMIDMLGINCAINYLHAKRIRVDNKKSVYKIPLLFEEFKITDIYFGNYRIDVITLFKEKTVKIPKVHVDMDILPHFYFVVQIGAKIKEAKMIGFIEAKKITKCSSDSKFFYPTLDMIFGIDRFMTLTKQSVPTKTLLGKHVDCMGLFLKFIDNDLSSVYKRQLIQHLMNCDSCRSRFIDTMEFERLAGNIRFYPELMRKYETKAEIEDVAIEYDRQTKFESFEEGLKNASIIPVEEAKPAFIDIDNNKSIKDECEEEKPKIVQMFDIAQTKQIKKNVIDAIFDEIPKIELPQIKTIASAKNRRSLLIALVLIFVLGTFTLISVKNSPEIDKPQDEQMADFEEFSEDYDVEDYNNNSSDGYAKLIPKDTTNIENFTIQQPISTKPTYSPTITNISWEAPESLVKKANYTKFLQLIGKNVKLNLQNDLLLVNDIPVNKVAKVDINIASNGNVNSIKMSASSGTPSIDASIKKIVNETFSYMKPPAHGIISKSVDITLTIELD